METQKITLEDFSAYYHEHREELIPLFHGRYVAFVKTKEGKVKPLAAFDDMMEGIEVMARRVGYGHFLFRKVVYACEEEVVRIPEYV